MIFDKVKAIVAKAERVQEIRALDLVKHGEALDELVLLEATLPYDIIAVKTELLTMFEEEPK
jgi:hypothetical protein